MQHQAHSHALSLVCIAAPADASSLARWETYVLPLQQTGFLSVWSERSLLPGEERWTAWAAHLDQAEVVVLLLSADFFASEECRTLMSRALQRRQEGAAQIIPLLVRPVLWRESPLGTLACLPANEVPVLSWENQDEGWLACVLGLQQFLGYSFSRAQESPPDKRDHSDRGRLLRWLQRDYQRDLDESLERLFWLELGLTEQPDAVRNAIHLLQRRP
ncbi:MAG TPA: toll/interleukin-1 receptor domain-containing protein, partial [Ktedonobacteraceae bacterium]|nr:toll/interleukin-1 receptor domain-containing protein [Ktedonobacteraceae bacterium]